MHRLAIGECWIPVLALALFVSAGCEFPRDAAGTLERVQREGVLRAGYSVRPPWVEETGARPAGIEPRLIEAFAAARGARVEWTRGAESALIDALRGHRIDVAVGGFEKRSPLVSHAAASQVFRRTAIVIAVADEREAATFKPQGQTIAHATGRPDLAALIAGQGAKPEAVAQPGGRAAAVYDFEAQSLGLKPTSITLATREHVVLVAQGESRLLYELDRFLATPRQQAGTAPSAAASSGPR
jgi:ABC-type amino acid transport substrate-binding protein